MAQFGTAEVYEEMARLLNADPEWTEKRGVKISYTMVYDYGAPIDKAFFVRFEEGKVTEVKELASRGDIAADFVIAGDGDVWRGVLTKAIDPTIALTRGQLKVQGKMSTLLKNMNAFKYIIDTMTEIELT
jgi:putative sterol carrier protein